MNKTNKFASYVAEFANLHQLFTPNGHYVVAMSGGLDSMVLGHIMLLLLPQKFKVIHFNHGTRKENVDEENLVREFCLKNNLEIDVVTLSLSLEDKNFEAAARQLRKDHFKKYQINGCKILTAHHLDDSFEWSLMQKFKQGNHNQTLGIPLMGKGYIRPFLCVSKKQIYHYAVLNKILWLEDQSNHDIHHERNYMRLKIISQIKKRYPQYLKHYAYQANQMAFDQNVHQLKKLQLQFPVKVYKHFLSGYVLQSNRLDLHRDKIVKVIIKLSHSNRGKVNIVIDQLVKTINEMRANPKKIAFHGPYKIAGDVQLYLFKDRLLICNSDLIDQFKNIDTELKKFICNRTHIPCGFVNNSHPKYFPNIFIEQNGTKLSKRSRLELLFYQDTCRYLKQSDIPYNFVEA